MQSVLESRPSVWAAAMSNGTCCFHYVARTVSLHPGKLGDLSPAGAAEVILVTLSLHSWFILAWRAHFPPWPPALPWPDPPRRATCLEVHRTWAVMTVLCLYFLSGEINQKGKGCKKKKTEKQHREEFKSSKVGMSQNVSLTRLFPQKIQLKKKKNPQECCILFHIDYY